MGGQPQFGGDNSYFSTLMGSGAKTTQTYQPASFAAPLQANAVQQEPLVSVDPVDPDDLALGEDSHVTLAAQINNQPQYEDDKSCGGGCNNNGICFNSVCYCNKYHSGEKCDKDMAHPGVKAPVTFVFYGVALMLGIVTGAFVAKIYNENDKKLFI